MEQLSLVPIMDPPCSVGSPRPSSGELWAPELVSKREATRADARSAARSDESNLAESKVAESKVAQRGSRAGRRGARRGGVGRRPAQVRGVPSATVSPHLAAAQRLQRQLRQATPYSAEQTNTGRLICRHLVAMLKAQEADQQSSRQGAPSASSQKVHELAS